MTSVGNEKMNVDKESAPTKSKATTKRPTGDHTLHNLRIALAYAESGVPVFPTVDKSPCVPRFQKLDSEIDADDLAGAIQAFRDKHGRDPVHVGSTTNPAAIKRIWREIPDATPSLCPGLVGLIVLDADFKPEKGIDGPSRLKELAAAHGGIPPECPVTRTQGKGMHVFYRDPDKHTNAAGALHDLGIDVRGYAGQVVVPSSIRDDGKRYTRDKGHDALLAGLKNGTIPLLPQWAKAKIGERPERSKEPSNTEQDQAAAIILSSTWPAWEEAFGGGPLAHNINKLIARSPTFREDYEAAGSDESGIDRSDTRFRLAGKLRAAFPSLTLLELATFFNELPGLGTYTTGTPEEGEYNARDIARCFLKNAGNINVETDGEAFGAVVDDDDEGDNSESFDALRPKGVQYLDDILISVDVEIDWSIKNVKARGTISLEVGTWGSGKTAMKLDQLLHISYGMSWRGRRVKRGVAMFVGLENPDDVRRRIKAWHKMMEGKGHVFDSPGAFVFYDKAVSLIQRDGDAPTASEKDIIKTMREAAAHFGVDPATIVIDTVAQSFGGGSDENNAADVGRYVKAMGRMARKTGANVTALHHPPKSASGPRGSGAWSGDVDTVIEYVEKDGRKVMQATSKFRIGDARKCFEPYKLEPFQTGVDEDGEPITVVLAHEVGRCDVGAAPGDDAPDVPLIAKSDDAADRLAMTMATIQELAADPASVGAAEDAEPSDVPIKLARIIADVNSRRAGFKTHKGLQFAELDNSLGRRPVLAAERAGLVETEKVGGAVYVTLTPKGAAWSP